jgi:hypothetical protein
MPPTNQRWELGAFKKSGWMLGHSLGPLGFANLVRLWIAGKSPPGRSGICQDCAFADLTDRSIRCQSKSQHCDSA